MYTKDYIRLDKQNRPIELQLTVMVIEDEGVFVSYSPALEYTSYGSSVEEARSAFSDALYLYFDHCIEHGTLLGDLKKHGWEFESDSIQGPDEFDFAGIPSGMIKKQYWHNQQLTFA